MERGESGAWPEQTEQDGDQDPIAGFLKSSLVTAAVDGGDDMEQTNRKHTEAMAAASPG